MKNLKKKIIAVLTSALIAATMFIHPSAASTKLSIDQIKAKVSCIIAGSCKKNIKKDISDIIKNLKNKAEQNDNNQNTETDKTETNNTTEKPVTPTDNETNNETNKESNKENNTDTNNSANVEEVKSSVLENEKEVVRLVNEIRASYGLGELKLNEKLCSVAREKSQNMHDLNYFSHTSPTYGSPFDMMKKFGITYKTAGENIAMGYSTPKAVVDAWMNSEGHRANILNSSYTEIGVGYVASGNYWTQMFIG